MKDLEAVALGVGKHKEVSRTGILPEFVGDETVGLSEPLRMSPGSIATKTRVAGPAEIIVGRIHRRPTGMTWQGKKKLGWRKDPYHSVGV
jgi:hypothetical protein